MDACPYNHNTPWKLAVAVKNEFNTEVLIHELPIQSLGLNEPHGLMGFELMFMNCKGL